MNTRRWICWFFSAALLTSPGASVEQEHKPLIETIFTRLSFQPHFPDEKDFLAEYGEGFIQKHESGRYRVYYLSEHALWLRIKIEANQVESYVVGLLLSKVPLASERRPPRRKISEITIQGVKLGDSPTKLEKLFGKPLRKYKAALTPNKSLTVLEFFPKTLEPGSCIRLYMKNGFIAAFSFSSEV